MLHRLVTLKYVLIDVHNLIKYFFEKSIKPFRD